MKRDRYPKLIPLNSSCTGSWMSLKKRGGDDAFTIHGDGSQFPGSLARNSGRYLLISQAHGPPVTQYGVQICLKITSGIVNLLRSSLYGLQDTYGVFFSKFRLDE